MRPGVARMHRTAVRGNHRDAVVATLIAAWFFTPLRMGFLQSPVGALSRAFLPLRQTTGNYSRPKDSTARAR